MRSVSIIPFDAREQRVLLGLARWMGLLGRCQVVAAIALTLTLMTLLGMITTAEVFEASSRGADTPPLVTVGDVSWEAATAVAVAVFALAVVLFRGGVLLIVGAEDLEGVLGPDELDQHHLEKGLRRLSDYFLLELLQWVAIGGLALWLFGAT